LSAQELCTPDSETSVEIRESRCESPDPVTEQFTSETKFPEFIAIGGDSGDVIRFSSESGWHLEATLAMPREEVLESRGQLYAQSCQDLFGFGEGEHPSRITAHFLKKPKHGWTIYSWCEVHVWVPPVHRKEVPDRLVCKDDAVKPLRSCFSILRVNYGVRGGWIKGAPSPANDEDQNIGSGFDDLLAVLDSREVGRNREGRVLAEYWFMTPTGNFGSKVFAQRSQVEAS
jgi:hypothetical protein